MTERIVAVILRAFTDGALMKKRFIAGVVCPKCGAQDSIMAFEDDTEKVMIRECVDCGFTDRLSTVVNAPTEVKTRVTPESVAPSDDTVQVVKILNPDEGKAGE